MSCRRSDRYRRWPGARGQRGAALVVAMFIFAICTALIVAMKGEFTRFYQRSANLLAMAQAQSYLRGAEELASLALIADYDSDKETQDLRDHLKETWASEAQPYAIDGGGWMAGTLVDLQGRFNLNSLASKPRSQQGTGPAAQRFTVAQRQFIRLLQALGEPEISQFEAIAITQSVSDWVDADDTPYSDGAEDQYYYSQTPSYRAANQSMASVSELRSVANITPEIYAALRPYVTVWPRDFDANKHKLNIHTAPAVVLRSLNEDTVLDPLSESEGEELIQTREEQGFQDINALRDHPVFDGRRDKMRDTWPLVGETSDWFLLDAQVELADRNMRLYSVLWRDNRNIWAVSRSSGGR
ncbi:MAG: type II secretion system minor pseudopilin GspK [Halioglobus sp.]